MKEIKMTQLNNLGNELISIIKRRTNIFKTIEIVVPNSKTEQWFKNYWLKNQNDILMNVKFININEAIKKLFDVDKNYSLLTREEMKTLIIKQIFNDNIDIPDTIRKYYNSNNVISAIKLYDLADQLSKLFLEYEQDQFVVSGWQKQLYDSVLEEARLYNLSTVSYIYNIISDKKIKKIDNEIYFFGFHVFTRLQTEILNQVAENKIFKLLLTKEDDYSKEFSLTGAPSKIREIESIHSKICTLIKEKNIEYSDVLVLAPDISLYENIIARVFKQDNIKYPNIPYTINDKKKIETNVSLGLKKLFEIINKKYYTRLDFFTLINNKDIQNARNINEEDVFNWLKSIVAMNAYRNSESRTDWEYVKKRVLLSKISNVNDVDNNIIELTNQAYIPFTNIEFDDQSIIKFVSIIDDLQSWLNCINSMKNINNNNLDIILNELNKWFSIKDINGFETNGYYKSIINLINYWKKIGISNDNIPLNTLVYQLYDVSKVINFKSSDYFVRGITFADFDLDAIISSKYIFFLNAGSKDLPKQVFKSELDLREYDISMKEKIDQAFCLQYQNAFDTFYISYINKDLKTDEDLYLSSIVSKLYYSINKDIKDIKQEKLALDETRGWFELFTKKSYKNKSYYEGLIDEDESKNVLEYNNNAIIKSERRKKISVSEMADFLKEPLKYKINYLFSKEDTLQDDIKTEYEPFDLNALSSYGLVKNICLDALINKNYILDDKTVNTLLARYNLNHQLPDINDKINYMAFKKVIDRSQELIRYVVNKTNYNYDIISLDDLTFIDSIRNGDDELTTEWCLTCKDKVCVSKNGCNRIYIQIKKLINKDDSHEYLFLYIFALMDLVSDAKNNDEFIDANYTIELCRGEIRTFNITVVEAKEILISIYNLMNSYKDNVCLPIELFENNKINTLNDFIKELTKDGGPWSFFDDKNILDFESQLGYTDYNFLTKFKSKKEELIKLIKYYKEENQESDGDKDD